MQRFAGKIIFALVCCITLVIAGQAAASMPQPERQKYAILIGIDEYSGSGFGQLQGAKNDIALIEKVLMGRLQFKQANIYKLLDHDANHTKIAAAFTQLAERVDSGDSVYIHYSGHGSETPDLNGDEKDNRKLDSTWVSYGSRVSADAVPSPKADGSRSGAPLTAAEVSASIDNFDILDDELNGWLAKISAKTDQLVFVSDSCHSGTITRGGNDPSQLGTRGIIEDTRHHPLGALPAVSGNLAGIRISACRDKEEAGEYRGPDGKPHGIFSLFWAQALEQAQPQDTWEMLAKRTGALVEANATRGQHPVFEPRNCSVFLTSEKNFRQTAVISSAAPYVLPARFFSSASGNSIFRAFAMAFVISAPPKEKRLT